MYVGFGAITTFQKFPDNSMRDGEKEGKSFFIAPLLMQNNALVWVVVFNSVFAVSKTLLYCTNPVTFTGVHCQWFPRWDSRRTFFSHTDYDCGIQKNKNKQSSLSHLFV